MTFNPLSQLYRLVVPNMGHISHRWLNVLGQFHNDILVCIIDVILLTEGAIRGMNI